MFMILIPHGWIYGGNGCSHRTEKEAEHHIKLLQKIFPHHDFKIILDDSGGKNYEKWIIITNNDVFGNLIKPEDRKKKTTKPKKRKTKKCKCK